jgi:hypothetical protein
MAMRMKDIAHTFFHQRLRILLIFSLSLLLLPFQSTPSHAASPPSAPQYVEAMADMNQVAITWDPPGNNGGESNLNYTVRIWNLPPPTNTAAFASCSTSQLGCVISGLISGTIYYVDVIASNSAGAGAPSASKSISPGATGKPPSNVSATSDAKGLITIKWTPLTSAGTGVFAWYTAEVFTGTDIGVGSYSGYCTSGAITDSSCFIGGLKLGATYYAQVRTYTSLGSGFPSFPRIKIVAGTVAASTASPTPTTAVPTGTVSPKATNSPSPSSSSKATPVPTGLAANSDPPQQVKVVALSKALRVSWNPPKHSGSLKILGYRVEAFGGGIDALMHECRTSAKVLTCTLKNLGAKQVYNLAVFVVFAGKESPSSKIFRVVTKS